MLDDVRRQLAVLDSVESSAHRRDVRSVLNEVLELLEVIAKEPLMGVPGPSRHTGELTRTEWSELAVDVESRTVARWLGQPELGEAAQCIC